VQTMWADIGNDSTLKLATSRLRLRDDIDDLP
jgi:hypothetical protein